jgi:hypothetical protein
MNFQPGNIVRIKDNGFLASLKGNPNRKRLLIASRFKLLYKASTPSHPSIPTLWRANKLDEFDSSAEPVFLASDDIEKTGENEHPETKETT